MPRGDKACPDPVLGHVLSGGRVARNDSRSRGHATNRAGGHQLAGSVPPPDRDPTMTGAHNPDTDADPDAPDSTAQTMSPARSRRRGRMRPGRLPSPPIEARITSAAKRAKPSIGAVDLTPVRVPSPGSNAPVSAGHSRMRRFPGIVHDYSRTVVTAVFTKVFTV